MAEEGKDLQLWSSIADQLHKADDLIDKGKTIEQEFKSAANHFEGVESSKKVEARKQFDDAYNKLDKTTQEQLDSYESVLERLTTLRGILSRSEADERDFKKRKVEAPPSPSISSLSSPTLSAAGASSEPVSPELGKKGDLPSESKGIADKAAGPGKFGDQKGKGKGWRKGLTLTPATNQTVPTTTSNTLSTQGGYVDPAKVRREQLGSQLPLQKGRKVAFRQPMAKKTGKDGKDIVPVVPQVVPGGPGQSEEDGETWILATVIECINNDRNRYVVRDAEVDEHGNAPTWNTTLKAIVPLPITWQTLPPKDYSVGSKVLALYPDTSCFYQATVRGGGPGMHKTAQSKVAKKEAELLNTPYQLTFEDDNNEIRLVAAYLVVERPRL